MSEWQPIETAPEKKDILVAAPDKDSGWVAWVDWYNGGGHQNESSWSTFPRLVWLPMLPTHWMPLPPPPVETERR